MDRRRVLIADASVTFCSDLAGFLGENCETRICYDGYEALSATEDFHPDVLVLDMALPNMDGISLLKVLRSRGSRIPVLLTTCFFSDYIGTAVNAFSVDMVVIKPCDLPSLADRVRDLANKNVSAIRMDRTPATAAQIMLSLNFPANRKGFLYLNECIAMHLKEPTISITKEMYPRVARNHDTSPAAVERAIRDAIFVAKNLGSESNWRVYFAPCWDGTVLRPTNSQFIPQISEHLRLQSTEKAVGYREL